MIDLMVAVFSEGTVSAVGAVVVAAVVFVPAAVEEEEDVVVLVVVVVQGVAFADFVVWVESVEELGFGL